MVKILVFEPNKEAYVKMVDENDLTTFQNIVDGYLESFPIITPSGERYIGFCNEEGLLNKLPQNRQVNGLTIYGPFFVSRFDGSSEITSINDEDIKLITSYIK